SIAAISHVELNSKLTEDELGTLLIIEGSEIKKNNECSSTNGTSIKVKNLFYNVPARRNFLKSDQVELRHITEEFCRVSLANPKVKMQFFSNNNELYHLPQSNFRQRIVNVFGNKKNESLVPLEEETSLVKLNGFIGKPESAKRTRGEQYFFVNNRFIKNNYLNHAVKKAFEEVIPQNYFPSYFINLSIDTNLIDINIHPTKTEIKFEDEKSIYAIIRATVKKSLGSYNIAPSIDFSQEQAFDIDTSLRKSKNIKEPIIKVDSNYNPFNNKKNNNYDNSEYLQENLIKEFTEKKIEKTFQIGNCYIVYPNDNGLLLIHQRRAHKRILFEYYKNAFKNEKSKSQTLLFAKSIKLNTKDIKIVSSIRTELNKIGFLFKIEKNELVFDGIPSECQEINLQPLIENIIEQNKSSDIIKLDVKNNLAKSLAISLAISKQKKLSNDEQRMIKEELLKCETPSVCPSKKRTMINLKTSDLEKYF
ncbi:MAG: DNA mismatch repair endonuclease MutL, partial [Flavobacteriales bacterium]|nr:DNA mismatch repair endonuclease MutL [Flavobacteriales bacterium]